MRQGQRNGRAGAAASGLRLGFGPVLLAIAVAAVVAVSGLRLATKALAPAPFTARLVATVAVENMPPGPVALVALDPQAGELSIERLALPVRAPGQVQRLWLIGGGADPLPLGPLPAQGPVTLTLPEDARAALRPGALLMISAEPETAPPAGPPTGAALAAGPIARR